VSQGKKLNVSQTTYSLGER